MPRTPSYGEEWSVLQCVAMCCVTGYRHIKARPAPLFLASLRFCVHYCIDRDTVQKKKNRASRGFFVVMSTTNLPRSPGTGEGGNWWSSPMGVKAKGMLRVCQGESSNFRIL